MSSEVRSNENTIGFTGIITIHVYNALFGVSRDIGVLEEFFRIHFGALGEVSIASVDRSFGVRSIKYRRVFGVRAQVRSGHVLGRAGEDVLEEVRWGRSTLCCFLHAIYDTIKTAATAGRSAVGFEYEGPGSWLAGRARFLDLRKYTRCTSRKVRRCADSCAHSAASQTTGNGRIDQIPRIEFAVCVEVFLTTIRHQLLRTLGSGFFDGVARDVAGEASDGLAEHARGQSCGHGGFETSSEDAGASSGGIAILGTRCRERGVLVLTHHGLIALRLVTR